MTGDRTNLYAVDGLCHNAEPGTYGHECGKPARWLGLSRSGMWSGFCDLCRKDGYEARGRTAWEVHPAIPRDEDIRAYRIILTISADTPADLRRCDVSRVVEAAADAGLPGFALWLRGERPDLAKVIREALADLTAA